MIQGRVISLQALIEVMLRRSGQPDMTIEFIVDTGFEGALTLPVSVVAEIGLPFVTELTTTLANDTAFSAPVHKATIV